jgi:hypothetical protein
MDNIKQNEILTKINNLHEQISIRETVPINQRTEKQSIKLDNLHHELKQLYALNNDKK